MLVYTAKNRWTKLNFDKYLGINIYNYYFWQFGVTYIL